MLEHGTDKASSVMSQPYSSLEHSGGRSSVSSSSRKSSYSSLLSPGDGTIDEVYECPSDQPDSGPSNLSVPSQGEEYGRLDHNNRYPPELPLRRKTSQQNEYGTLDHSGELRPGSSSQQDQQYGRLNHSISTPECTQRRTVSQPSEYGRLEHSTHRKTSNTVAGSTGLQENDEYARLQNSGQHVSSYKTPVGLQQNEYDRLDHDDHGPDLPPQTNASPQEYELLVHSSQQSNNQDNEYGRLDHTGHTPELPRKGVIVQDGEYGKLEHSVQQGTPSSNLQSNRHSEYHKLELGTESSAAYRSQSDHLDQVNATDQQLYSQLKPPSHSSVVLLNEPGGWTQGSSDEQHYNVPRKLVTSKSTPLPVIYQGQKSGKNESTGETNYMHPKKTKEFSFSSQNDNVPSGYESFKRDYGTSISTAINSYSSDPEEDSITGQSEVTHSGDGEYSVLSPVLADDKSLVMQSDNAASHIKPKIHVKQKPIPKPRHA